MPGAARHPRPSSAVIDGANVNYYMAGSRGGPPSPIAARPSTSTTPAARESILAALQLSAQKWGTISVRGDDQFKRTCVELAAEHGFKIVNPELQRAIDGRTRATDQTEQRGARSAFRYRDGSS